MEGAMNRRGLAAMYFLSLWTTVSWPEPTSAERISAYTFVAVDYPGALATYATDINDAGTIVGHYLNPDRSTGASFVLTAGSFSSLSCPGAYTTSTAATNNHGDMVGVYHHPEDGHVGFLFRDGVCNKLSVPGADETWLTDINDAGTIVGYYWLGGKGHGFVYAQERFETLDVPNATLTYVSSITNDDVIAGAYATETDLSRTIGFVWNGRKFRSFVAFPGADATIPAHMNDDKVIVGDSANYAAARPYHGFIGRNRKFNALDVPLSQVTWASGINNSGIVVGYYTPSGASDFRGFVAIPTH